MNLKQFKYVHILAREGSFSRAAEALNISQPSLSQYIKNIENQIGLTLFTRNSGDVRLTDAGRIYLEAGIKILDLEHQMENKFADLAAFKGGTITLGISPYRSVHMIPPVFREFNKKYPDMKLIIKEKSGHDLIAAAEHGEFDLCVIALPVDKEVFETEIISKEEILIAVGKDTIFYRKLKDNAFEIPGRKYPAVDIVMAQDQDFAMLSEYMPMRNVTDNMLKKYGITINEKIQVSSNEALLSIVKSGACASFVPSGLAGEEGNIAFFSLEQDIELRDIGVIYHKNQYLSQPITDLIQILKTVT